MLNDKEKKIMEIISETSQKMKDFDLGLPLAVAFDKIKQSGVYNSERMIRNKMEKFEHMGIIKVKNWNIIAVNRKAIKG